MNRTQQDLRSPRSRGDVVVRLKTGIWACSFALLWYFAVVLIDPGWVTYLLSLPACGIVMITAWARINDLSVEIAGPSWNVRRAGLIFTSLFAVGVLVWPLLYGTWTPWLVVIGIWGFAMTWLTTPHQPPWNKWAFGDYRAEDHHHPHRRKEDDFDSN